MGESMQGKNDLLSQIGRGLRFSKYELAEYDEDILVAFLEDGQAIFHDIPDDMVTDLIRLTAAQFDKTGMIMQHMQPNVTPGYRDLAIASVMSDWRNLKDIDAHWVDRDFMFAVLDKAPSAIYAFFSHHSALAHATVDQSGLEQFLLIHPHARDLMVSAFVVGHLTTPLISDDFIQKSTMSLAGLGSPMFKSPKQHLMIEGIKAGGWPDTLLADKPTDLEHGVKLAMKATSSLKLHWHKAFIKTHDIKDVIKAMKTPAREEMLLSLYSRAELQPYMKRNQRVKGKWLEEEMGL